MWVIIVFGTLIFISYGIAFYIDDHIQEWTMKWYGVKTYEDIKEELNGHRRIRR